MSHPRPKRRDFIAERIRFGVRDHWKIALLVAGLVVLAIVLGLWRYRDDAATVVEERAELIRFGVTSDYDGDHPTVIVRLRDGSVRQLSASRASVRLCRVGGGIRVLRSENTLRVSPFGCAPAAP